MPTIDQIIEDLRGQVGWTAATLRQAITEINKGKGESALLKQRLLDQTRDIQSLSSALASVRGGGASGAAAGGSGNGTQVGRDSENRIVYLEDIPGRRIPFDLILNIPIGSNVTAEQQGTVTVSQDGPFVAVARVATFRSAYEFSKTDPETSESATFQGRSYGRFRPIHSMGDVNDSFAGVFQPTAPIAPPGTGAPVVASPSNHSSFRSMEFDGLIELLNQGAAYPRSNNPIPSAFWVSEMNSVFQLGALDFFERGEVIQIKVTPTHANNPAFGNISALVGGGDFPFLDSQYDVHEGINDEFVADVTTDPVQRNPNGFLQLVLHGFRIIQPPGPVRLT